MNQLLLRRAFVSRATRATADQTATVGQLRERHLEAVFHYARRRLPSRDDAEDATAETFAAAFSSLRRCPRDEALHRAWLLGIARRKVADLLRKRYRRNESVPDTLPELPDPSPSPEALALRHADARALRRAVHSLAPLQCEALLLRFVDDLSAAEIGQVLGKSEAAVNSLLQRARASVFERAAYHFLPEEESR